MFKTTILLNVLFYEYLLHFFFCTMTTIKIKQLKKTNEVLGSENLSKFVLKPHRDKKNTTDYVIEIETKRYSGLR